MVHAHAINEAFRVEAKHRGVHRFENVTVFDAHGHKLVDIEEAPPVDLVVGASPPRQPVVLSLQKIMQPIAVRHRICGKLAKRTGTNAAGRHWELVIEITDDGLAPLVDVELYLASRQGLTVWPAEDWQQHLAVQLRIARRPVDVEISG